jgi:hypothetical protein
MSKQPAATGNASGIYNPYKKYYSSRKANIDDNF